MKNVYIYFVAALAVLAFSACSTNDDDNPSSSSSSSSAIKPSSSSAGGTKPSSSSTGGSGLRSGVCYFPNVYENNDEVNYDMGLCLEGITESITRSDCEDLGEDMEATSNLLNSCPSGYKLKCIDDEEEGYYYIYGQVLADNNVTCEFFDLNSVTTSSSSAGGTRPSSSSAGGSETGVCYVNSSALDWQYCLDGKDDPITRSDCESYGNTFMKSCPPDPKFECDFIDTHISLYGEDAESSDCELFDDIIYGKRHVNEKRHFNGIRHFKGF